VNGGWKTGTYEVVIRVDGIRLDPYALASMASEPFLFEIHNGLSGG
jgi:hypothetical protein